MKKSLLIVALSLAIAPLNFAADSSLKNEKDKVSYSIGLQVGTNLQHQSIDIDQDVFLHGLKDGIAGNKPLLTQDEMRETMQALQKEVMQKREEKRKAEADKNAAAGKAFLEANKSKPDVKTTASGLQYKVEKEGTGPTPKENDTVKVNYRGTTIDGKEFDSSYKRGQPASFPVNRVIKGWTEGLQLMKVGSKYQLFIPPDLAYGERGPGDIGPNSTLVFDVELLGIEKATPTPAASAGMTPPPNAKLGMTPATHSAASPSPKEP